MTKEIDTYRKLKHKISFSDAVAIYVRSWAKIPHKITEPGYEEKIKEHDIIAGTLLEAEGWTINELLEEAEEKQNKFLKDIE